MTRRRSKLSRQKAKRTRRALITIAKVFKLNLAELARTLNVPPLALKLWWIYGPVNSEVKQLEELAKIALYFQDMFGANFPAVARAPMRGLGMRSILEVLETRGTWPIIELIKSLGELIPGSGPILEPRVSDTNETSLE